MDVLIQCSKFENPVQNESKEVFNEKELEKGYGLCTYIFENF